MAVAVSKNDKYLVSASEAKSIKVHELQINQTKYSIEQAHAGTFWYKKIIHENFS